MFIKLLLILATFLLMTVEISHTSEKKYETATFAGGCFWCLEQIFENRDGVIEAISGYTGGHKENPTYQEVSSGTTGHLEAIQITFDPAEISYPELLDIFWMQIDPTDAGGQFVDRGPQYATAIFYHTPEQKRLAEISRENLVKSGTYDQPVVTGIKPATRFYKAEDYHQDFYKKSPIRYLSYKKGSGRDQFLKKIRGGKNETTDQHTKE